MKLILGDSAEKLKEITSDSIDLTVTSPPYDNLRTYNGYSFDFETIAKELYRVTKPGGVVVWVVNDETVDGSETGSSFKQALYFKSIGMRLHDTMIWEKLNPAPQGGRRYRSCFEFMFIFSKGSPNTFNPLEEECKRAGTVPKGSSQKRPNGTIREDRVEAQKTNVVKSHKKLNNIWKTAVANSKLHPATFPLQLALDHIISWSNPGDTVLDPFMGSGTTGVAALQLNRKFIGIEISEEYLQLSQARFIDVLKDVV